VTSGTHLLSSKPSQAMLRIASSPKGRALGSRVKFPVFTKSVFSMLFL